MESKFEEIVAEKREWYWALTGLATEVWSETENETKRNDQENNKSQD